MVIAGAKAPPPAEAGEEKIALLLEQRHNDDVEATTARLD
jgi:hypothetical protein